jgi:RNA polymerase sigma factor (TIGR02999 family)
MDARPPDEVTQLLRAWGRGDRAALDRLVPIVYRELRRLARHYMRGERGGHTLQTTALVNEAYLRLIDHTNIDWQNRAHFFGVAAQAMRRVLVDHARRRGYAKRGGGAVQVPLEEGALVAEERAEEVLAVNEALDRLEALDARKARVVELRFFGGLNNDEAAEVLGISEITVRREWQIAKAWLLRELARGGAGDDA